MKCLVTGANGFLGSWLCKTLILHGHQVRALVRRNSSLDELEGVPCEYAYGDVTDLSSLESALQGRDTVFHLAGVVAYKKKDRPKMQTVNVDGTSNLLKALAKHKGSVPSLLHVSSVVAVGAGLSPDQILDETSDYNVGHFHLGYFETKHQAELLVKDYADKNFGPAVIVNPSTIYGRGDAKKGSRKTQLKVAQGRFPFYTPGGVNVVAVQDVVRGILLAQEKGKQGNRYILSGENMTIQQLFQAIAKCAGVQAPNILLPQFVLEALGVVGDMMDQFGWKGPLSLENARVACMYHWFQNSKAQTELGFSASPAIHAIESSVAWMRDHGLLDRS